jgi:DNA polymerase I
MARWSSIECAQATTAFGRYYIKDVIARAGKSGFNVLYSDTDSIFMALGEKTKQNAENFSEKINQDLPGLMELEFDGFYSSGIFVSAKPVLLELRRNMLLLTRTGC